MIRTLIVEDEPQNRDLLKSMIAQYVEGVDIIGSAANVDEACLKIHELNPQLLLLDIQLEERNAFQLLEQFPQRSFEVIFTTAYEQYALQAIKHSGIDYLLKPIGLEELRTAVKKAEEKIQPTTSEAEEPSNTEPAPNDRIVVPTNQGFMLLDVGNIMYLQAEGAYTRIVLRDHSGVLVSQPIGVYEEKLKYPAFIRIHRSHVVNQQYIKQYVRGRGGYVLLENGDHLNVAVRKKADLLQALGSAGLAAVQK